MKSLFKKKMYFDCYLIEPFWVETGMIWDN